MSCFLLHFVQNDSIGLSYFIVVSELVTIVTLFQGQWIRFSNPTVLQYDSNFHLTNTVGLSRPDCTSRHLEKHEIYFLVKFQIFG